jgi:(p)ppGpp synthase/HD superfamily hydrolase
MWSPDLYQQAIRFAAVAHAGQQVPGTGLPYLLHLSTVCMEVCLALAHSPEGIDGDFAVACALLHDTIEDTAVTFEELEIRFRRPVAEGVLALTKNESIPDKRERMLDSLRRIRQQPREVAMVKLADRITNLQPPPSYWSPEKRQYYRREAQLILDHLTGTHPFLEERLARKIEAYSIKN